MIQDLGGIVHSYKCDLTKREEIYNVAERVKRDVGDVRNFCHSIFDRFDFTVMLLYLRNCKVIYVYIGFHSIFRSAAIVRLSFIT